MPTTPILGEIMPWGGNFAPVNWAKCEGQLMSVAQFPALFQLIGTTYGGDGVNTFALPDLRGRACLHMGTGTGLSNQVIGELSGTESVTLLTSQLPAHTHTLLEAPSSTSNAPVPDGRIPAAAAGDMQYAQPASPSPMAPAAVSFYGSAGPHENRQPYLAITLCICIAGTYPNFN